MSRSSGSIRLVVAFIVQLALIFSVRASNIGTNPTNPCEDPFDCRCSVQQSAMLAPVGVDGVGGSDIVGSKGCSSGGCGSGGGQPQFTAGIGINGAGFAGFNLPLGPAQRPGGMEGGKLVFQIKTLEAGGLPMSALQYSLAPAKPVMLVSGRVVRSDLWNKRHDYLSSANFILKAVNASDHTTLRMLDAQGQPVTNTPAMIELRNMSGDITRYRVGDTNLPEVAALPEYSFYDAELGLWRNPGDYGIAVARNSDGNLSEIVTAVSFTRIIPVNSFTFDVSVYPPEGRTSSVPAVVTYRVQGESDGVTQLSGDRSMVITEIRPGYTNESRFVYNPFNERWALTQGNGERHTLRFAVSTPPLETVTMEVYDHGGGLLAHRQDVRKSFAWGYETVVTTMGTGACVVVTSNDFYTTSSEVGRYANLKNIRKSNGDWVKFDYDSQGRIVRTTRCWKNMPYTDTVSDMNAVDIAYDYGSDPLNPFPLVKTEKIEGKMVQRTYGSRTNQYVQTLLPPVSTVVQVVAERAVLPDAAQGTSSNLVSTEYYFGSAGDAASQGAIKASIHEDGTMESYEYAFGSFHGTNDPCFTKDAGANHRTIKTHGTVTFPAGIAFKTTREITIRDPRGHIVFEETQVYTGSGYQRMGWSLHGYDAAGNRIRSDYSDGTHREWDYTPGRLVSSTDRDGTVTTFGYDGLGRLVDTTHKGVAPFGNYPGQPDRTTTIVYDAMHRAVVNMQVGGALALAAQTEYDILGRPLVQTDPAGVMTVYVYAANDLSRTVSRPGGLSVTTTRYIDGQPLSASENGVLKSAYDYGVNGDGTRWIKTFTGPAGASSPMWIKTTTDFLGRTVRVERPAYGAGQITNSYVYNTKGQMVLSTGNQQPATLGEYDELGRLTRSGMDVDNNGQLNLTGSDRVSDSIHQFIQRDGDWYDETLSLVYPDASGVPATNGITRTSAGGLSCGCAAQRLESVDILGNTSVEETKIDAANHRVIRSVHIPTSTNAATSVTYNGLQVEGVSATGVRTVIGYDALGRQVSVLQGEPGAPRQVGGTTHYAANGQVDWTMDTASNVTSFTYDSLGRRVAVTDALSNTTHTAYDMDGRVTNTWGATYPVAYRYDAYGRMALMKTFRSEGGAGDETTWLYDEATGLLTNKLYSNNLGPRYTYTPDGKLATRTWARGVVTTYNYDNLNQLTNINYSDATPDVSFTFNRLGQQATITDGQGTRLFSYTDAFQLAVETNSAAELVRVYDSQGRPSGYDLVRAGSSSVVSSIRYTHDEAGRFHQVDADLRATSLPLRNFRYGYLAGSDLVESLTETNTGINVARSYEQRRNLISQVLNTSGSNLISRFDYINDAVGRRTQRVDSFSLTNDFGYNVRRELIEAIMGTNHFSYCYDPIGNRRSATAVSGLTSNVSVYTANSLNQYSQITNNGALITPQYDLDGNMTAYGEWRFAWDAENRMTGASNAITVARYSYDFMSRRVRKIVNGVTNNFVYDGWNLISEITVGGAQSITNRYLWGLDLSGTQQGAGGIGGLLSVARNGVTYYPCYDANGNITDYVDQNGVVAAHQEYDAYGNTVVSSGLMVNDFNFWFSSKYLDRETGLYSFGLRYYAPEFGRFLSCDPARESTIGNQYGYLFNNSFYGIEFLGLLRVVFYDDDFTTEADALYLYWSATDPYERSIKVRVESVSAFQTGVAIINHYARLSGENVNKLVLMFHGFPEFITIGEGSALEFLSANGETATPLGNPATPISSLPDIPFGESAVIQLNTCRGGFPVGGGLKNVGQAFNDRYGVSTVAFPYWIKYAGEDSFVVIPTLSSLFIFPRLEFVTYPPKETPCKRKCPLLLLQ